MNRSPIIFYGTGRSGSSLISEIIFRHPDIAYASNFHNRFPRYFPNNYYRNVFENKFWKISGKKYQKDYNNVSIFNKFLFIPSEAWNLWKALLPKELNFDRSFLFDTTANSHVQEYIRQYFQVMVEQQGRNRLGLKITGPSRMVFLNSIFINPFFIQIKRGLIPTIHSFLHAPFWRNQGMHQLWWNDIYSVEEKELVLQNCKDPVWMTTFQLKKILDITALEKEMVALKNAEVKYEDFTANPESETERLLCFLGLSVHKDCFTYLKSIGIRHDVKQDSFYFSKGDLDTIYSILNRRK